MTYKYLAILAILPMLLTPAFGQYTLPLPEPEEEGSTMLPIPEPEKESRMLPIPEHVESDDEASGMLPEPELKIHKKFSPTMFVDVLTLFQNVINALNEVIGSVNSNTTDIAELKQQIIELQTP